MAEDRDGESAAVVDCGSLVVLAAGLSGRHRQDVLYSFLLAQLVADRKYKRHADPMRWYMSYGETLERIGWVVEEHEGFSRHRSDEVPYRVDSLIRETLARVADERISNAAVAAVRTLAAADPVDRAAELFEQQTHFGRAGNFQVGVAEEVGGGGGGGGVVVVRVGRVWFRAVDDATELVRLLHAEFRAADEVVRGAQVLHLNEDVHGPLRDEIAEKLGARVEVLIAPVGG
ncbi:hypothetical protein DEJ49_21120 [Streptomyces venezuelae]|uniref:Uncharacterized protein n=1 Tax=Streptomyces venezuelae TaxID=54571 RepID=A0A5P2CL23_STRVZ|nr:hypothetical protein [Streptomyces venezuelae]QES43153.1 hypothetical protein DEJ49_21120 [Streptomyces venezuelae]